MDQPLALRCGRTLNNRLCKVATSEHLGDARSNDATPLLTALYGRWAAGGWGLVITGNVMVDRRALEAPRNVVFDGATDMKQVSHWARARQKRRRPRTRAAVAPGAPVARRRELAPAPVVLCPEFPARRRRAPIT